MRKRLWPAVRIAFGIAGLAFLAVAFVETVDRVDGTVVPEAWRFAAAFALAGAGISLGARGWSALCGPARRSLAPGFFVAQLGKYIPGGIWQIAGQVGYARRSGAQTARVAGAVPVQMISFVAAGGVGAVVFSLVMPGSTRWFGLTGAAAVLLLNRRWMSRVLQISNRVTRRRIADEVLPPQRAIVEATVWNMAGMTALGGAYAVLSSNIAVSPAGLVAGWVVAWTAGFIAIIFPAGVGVREAALVGALGGPTVAAPVIAASVFHRLVTMAAEAALAGFGAVRQRELKRGPGI